MWKESFDEMCHKIFDAKCDGRDYLARPEDVNCRQCGNKLMVYYCEDRLYLVKCPHCHMLMFVKAKSPMDAALRFRGKLSEYEDGGSEE